MSAVLTFPAIDPVAIQIGPIAIRWYALAYVGGLLLGWRYCRHLASRSASGITPEAIDDFLIWAVAGVVLGGRIGYALFYKPEFFLSNPVEVVAVWHGGMSFHGGLLGVVVAALLFCRRRRFPVLATSDIFAAAAPIGLFLGRIANFVNGELVGRPSDVPWAIVFPHAGPLPRHPSQLYEALLEGLLLFLVLYLVSRSRSLRTRGGFATGVFLIGYGAARIFVEVFRQPDDHIGFLLGQTTMGQLLSLPMIVAGLGLIAWSLLRPPEAGVGVTEPSEGRHRSSTSSSRRV